MRDSLIQMLYKDRNTYAWIVLKIIKNESYVDDVIQETALKLARMNDESFPEDSSKKSWLGTVVRNRALSLYNDLKEEMECKDRSYNDPADGLMEDGAATGHSVRQLSTDITPEVQLLDEEQTARVKKAIQKLPPQQREVAEAVFLMGLNHVEAAQFLNYDSYDTCKANYRHAALALKEMLSGVA